MRRGSHRNPLLRVCTNVERATHPTPPFLDNPVPYLRLTISPPTASSRLQSPFQYDDSLCVQVTDSIGNKAKSSLTVIVLAAVQRPLDANLLAGGEVSVGDPVVGRFTAIYGNPPYTATALLAAARLCFLPGSGLHSRISTSTRRTDDSHPGEGRLRIHCDQRGNNRRLPNSRPQCVSVQSHIRKAVLAAVLRGQCGPPYSWAAIPGDEFNAWLPAGLTFTSAGLLSGTPQETGYFSSAGRISDAFGNSPGPSSSAAWSRP